MASEKTKNIVKKLTEKVNENTAAKNAITPFISPVEDTIGEFAPSIQAFDNQIISIVAQIHSKQAQIVSIATTAQYVVGCGTTTSTGLNQDLAQVQTWNLSSSGYTGSQPYGGITNSTLNSSTTGIGSLTVYSNNGGASLGTYYALLGPGYGTSIDGVTVITPVAKDNADCTACKNAISTLESEITTLRSQISSLLSTANTLKGERTEYEIRRYSLEKGVEQLDADSTRINATLTILTDQNNDAII